jgi:hypothetical protein
MMLAQPRDTLTRHSFGKHIPIPKQAQPADATTCSGTTLPYQTCLITALRLQNLYPRESRDAPSTLPQPLP